jgi:hypothetical protein
MPWGVGRPGRAHSSGVLFLEGGEVSFSCCYCCYCCCCYCYARFRQAVGPEDNAGWERSPSRETREGQLKGKGGSWEKWGP